MRHIHRHIRLMKSAEENIFNSFIKSFFDEVGYEQNVAIANTNAFAQHLKDSENLDVRKILSTRDLILEKKNRIKHLRHALKKEMENLTEKGFLSLTEIFRTTPTIPNKRFGSHRQLRPVSIKQIIDLKPLITKEITEKDKIEVIARDVAKSLQGLRYKRTNASIKSEVFKKLAIGLSGRATPKEIRGISSRVVSGIFDTKKDIRQIKYSTRASSTHDVIPSIERK
jgi:hypothetical protein